MDLWRQGDERLDADKGRHADYGAAVGRVGDDCGGSDGECGGTGAAGCAVGGDAAAAGKQRRARAVEWVAAACSLAAAVERRGMRDELDADEVMALMRLDKAMRQIRTCA